MNPSVLNTIQRIVRHMHDPIIPPKKTSRTKPWNAGKPVIGPDGRRYDTIGIAISETGLRRDQIWNKIHYGKGGWRYAEQGE